MEKCGKSVRLIVPLDALEPLTWPRRLLQYKHDQNHGMRFEEDRRGIPKWQCADDEDMEKVRALQDVKHLREDFDRKALWGCSLCPVYNASWNLMTAHLEKRWVLPSMSFVSQSRSLFACRRDRHEIADSCQAKLDGVVYLHPTADGSKMWENMV